MEADHKKIIAGLKEYLKYIPRPYEADCYACTGCGGVRLDMYNDFEFPLDYSFDEIHKAHKYFKNNRVNSCDSKSNHCENMCWDGGYFRKWNYKYIYFMKHFLQYCSENSSCSCYWPEKSLYARLINNKVFRLLKDFGDKELINFEFSPYWVAREIDFDYYQGKMYGAEYYPNAHGMASSLTTYSFFYSQYHQMLLDVATFIDSNAIVYEPNAIDQIYQTLENIQRDFSYHYDRCLSLHPHPKIYYERGMLRFHSGQTEEALADILQLTTEQYRYQIVMNSEMYQQEGQAYADLGIYDKAIVALTKAITQDPENKEAYFVRASAYFETGNFEKALSDYLKSEKSKEFTKIKPKISQEFKDALLNALLVGGQEAAVEFFPSLYHTAHGVTSSLWAFVNHPLDTTTYFCNACYEMGVYTAKFCKKFDWDQIEGYSEEFKNLCDRFEDLSSAEKGHLIGYIIGKYGIDVFVGGTTIKGVALLKNLKNANRVCNLETMASSLSNREVLLASASRHALDREKYFKNIKIHWDKQGKHIPGKHNYIEGRSIFEHSDAQGLLEKFAGTGTPIKNRMPGSSDYREKINFSEFIGYHVNEKTGIKTSTTWGEVRYSKTGAHIIPVFPGEAL